MTPAGLAAHQAAADLRSLGQIPGWRDLGDAPSAVVAGIRAVFAAEAEAMEAIRIEVEARRREVSGG